jgi:hypothetical protein
MTNVWQIAAGEPRRYYDHLFIEHDVMFMGPGRHGCYGDNRAKYGQVRNGLRRFVEHVHEGDVVLLRLGQVAKAIGLAAGDDYAWCDTFDDVFGWDLQHTRRVIWQEDLKDELNRVQPEEGFFRSKQSATFSAVNNPKVLEQIEPLLSRCRERPLQALPDKPPPPLAPADLGRELFARGLANEAVDKTLAAIERQRRLWLWYDEHGRATGRPTEHEVVAHMVVPLLLALGWSEQLLAVEWKRIDLAGFSGTPTDESNCVLACEAKVMGHGLQDVLPQPEQYVQERKLTGCQKVLLTDGARFYLYERDGRKWSDTAKGYLNVNLIRTSHLAPPDTNAVATIVALTPAGVVRRLSNRP